LDKLLSCTFKSSKIKLYNENFLEFTVDKKYDLIIGNPPFKVLQKKEVDKKYYKYFNGRPNIFILFIIKSLEMLNVDGILAFVLPKNFTNCQYYDKTRQYINENFKIIDLIECNDKYLETQQHTIVLIVRNIGGSINDDFVLKMSEYTIFGTKKNIIEVNKLLESSTTLDKLGFETHIGKVVWNQCKKELTNDETKTRLIYNSDIKDNKLDKATFKNEEKKNYIDQDGLDELIMVVNRGYGAGAYQFSYCLIDTTKYLIENHLICIKHQNITEK